MRYFFLPFSILLMVTQTFAQRKLNSIDSIMSANYPDDFPGAAIAIIRNGEVVFRKGYGITDLTLKRQITPTTNFNIGSLTKQFTAYCILKLAKENKLSLDDNIGKYIPDFNSKVAGKVTIRNLLTHSSGIVDHYEHVDKKQFKEFRDIDVLNAIKSVDSVYFPPGSIYRYSNTAFCLLSLIIERVSGYSFPEYIRENIFKPLKMNNSDVINPDFRISDRSYGYNSVNGSFKISDANQNFFFSTMGDGGIYASVNDYLKWIIAIQKETVLDPFLIKEAQSPQFPIDKSRNLFYGYGWFVAGSDENKIVYHTGSNGGFQSITFMVPSEKYSVIIFSNRTGIDVGEIVRKINRIFKINDSAYVSLDSLIS